MLRNQLWQGNKAVPVPGMNDFNSIDLAMVIHDSILKSSKSLVKPSVNIREEKKRKKQPALGPNAVE